MSSLSDYLEQQIIRHLFRTGSFTAPTVLGIALFTTPASDASAGTEVTGGSYARVTRNPLDANWSAPVDGTTSNVSVITFPTATANWGMITHAGIFDASSGGNLLMYAPLDESILVQTGDIFAFQPGQLVFSID